MAFVVEEIPDEHKLLHRVHRDHWIRADSESAFRPSSACFKKRPRLSVNWIAYSSVEHTRQPNSRAVISLVAGACRELEQKVEHSPLEEDDPSGCGPNQAHTDIVGNKTQAIADKMARLAYCEWSAE